MNFFGFSTEFYFSKLFKIQLNLLSHIYLEHVISMQNRGWYKEHET